MGLGRVVLEYGARKRPQKNFRLLYDGFAEGNSGPAGSVMSIQIIHKVGTLRLEPVHADALPAFSKSTKD